ncbi:YlbG family protein [Lactobacillus sp. DCY120]|uniref:YlbG family protein n=1 Tax=Bombilactobacillus apium TaxID=2675299 RepID=A0A850R037_9LACO|nr:YlbG family protein [Bombilactobacillus apium]NVY95710.1 YlbG family protein [Bombilactobacillus apium]
MEITSRQELIVWLSNCRLSKKLRRFGTVIYVSFKMNYVILYVDQADLETTVAQIQALKFVTEVQLSPRQELLTNFDGATSSLLSKIQSDEADLCE